MARPQSVLCSEVLLYTRYNTFTPSLYFVPFFLSCVGAQNVAIEMFKTHYGVVLLFVCVCFFFFFFGGGGGGGGGGGIPSLHALVFI